ncbi:MAG TPA: cupin domain-containing protein [Candidatus Levybacteria bacterium]|nr:cupin domain-containing protein [Candidatus Levybacteria bacterium]
MFKADIKDITKNNTNFRKVLHTGGNAQLVVMSILKGSEIGEEVHAGTDQILVFVQGKAKAVLNGEEKDFSKHDLLFVPAGTVHNIINSGDEDLKLYTIYAPPEHLDGTIHRTREDAQLEHSIKE